MSLDKTITQPLVEILREKGKLSDPRLEAAFTAIPRHIFLPDAPVEQVYDDTSIVIAYDTDGEALISSVMPSMLAQMLDQLQLESGQNVLEIGTGTGYFAALLRHVLGDKSTVSSVEIDREMVNIAEKNLQRLNFHNVNIAHGDGALGYAPRAAYDRIVSTVGVWDIPPAWIRQLKPDGLLVMPVWLDGLQVIATFRHDGKGGLVSDLNSGGAFVYIRGMAAGPNVRKRIGSTGLNMLADDVSKLDSVALHTLLSADHEWSYLSMTLTPEDYWDGVLPYLMLHEPEQDIFALYQINDGQKAYGVEGEGFALIMPGSACLVPYTGMGNCHSFAGADAQLVLEDILKKWVEAGKPDLSQLRLRLIPRGGNTPRAEQGKIYGRRDHHLHVWLDTPTTTP